jgi:hypothetical protein
MTKKYSQRTCVRCGRVRPINEMKQVGKRYACHGWLSSCARLISQEEEQVASQRLIQESKRREDEQRRRDRKERLLALMSAEIEASEEFKRLVAVVLTKDDFERAEKQYISAISPYKDDPFCLAVEGDDSAYGRALVQVKSTVNLSRDLLSFDRSMLNGLDLEKHSNSNPNPVGVTHVQLSKPYIPSAEFSLENHKGQKVDASLSQTSQKETKSQPQNKRGLFYYYIVNSLVLVLFLVLMYVLYGIVPTSDDLVLTVFFGWGIGWFFKKILLATWFALSTLLRLKF